MTARAVVACIAVAAVAQATAPQAPPATQAPPTAGELLARMKAKYAGCSTWREHARARCRKEESDDHWFRDEVYAVAFERPGRFRLEKGHASLWKYRGEEVVWGSGADWASWSRRAESPRPSTSPRPSSTLFFHDPMAEWVLPLLGVPALVDEEFGSQWDHFEPTGAVARESVEDVPVWQVEFVGGKSRDQRGRVAIDDGGGLRRIEFVEDGARGYHELIELAPEFDVALAPEELALSPPDRRGTSPNELLYLLSAASLVLLGLRGLRQAQQLRRTGKPFVVATGVFAPLAGLWIGAEALLRIAETWESTRGFSALSLVFGACTLGFPAWALFKFRRTSGFYAVGVSDAEFRVALRAAAEAMGAKAAIPAGGERATIDGDAIKLYAQPNRSIAGLNCEVPGARAKIRALRALVESCLASDLLQVDGAAARRAMFGSLGLMALGVVFFALVGGLLNQV